MKMKINKVAFIVRILTNNQNDNAVHELNSRGEKVPVSI